MSAANCFFHRVTERTGRSSGGKEEIIQDFTRGKILPGMLGFAVPFMISNALQVLYSLVDMMVVGRCVGSHALSAVTNASQLFLFFIMLSMGFSTGGQVYIAQLIGSGERERLNRTIGTLFTVNFLAGCVMTAVGFLFAEPLIRMLNTPADAVDAALDYFLVCTGGVIFSYGYNMVSAVLRGMGDSKHPFRFILIASILNAVLDLLFVPGFGWGVAGAALATVLGQGFSFLYALVFLYRRKEAFGFDFRPRSLLPDRTVLSGLLKLGIPFAVQSCAINISMLYVNYLINGAGVWASAAFGVGIKLDDMVNKVTLAFTFAVSGMVGQNMGARKFRRAERAVFASWGLTAGFYLVWTGLFLSFPEELFGLFSGDGEVRELAGVFAWTIVWSFPGMALMRGTNGFVQGVGNAVLSLVFALMDGFLFRILLSWYFGIHLGMGLKGFILGYGLAPLGTAIPGCVYFFSGIWKKRRLAIESGKVRPVKARAGAAG